MEVNGMNRYLHSSNVLTEFARLETDEPESILSKLVNTFTVVSFNNISKECNSPVTENLPTTECNILNKIGDEKYIQDDMSASDQPLNLQRSQHGSSHPEVLKMQRLNSVNVLDRLRNLVTQKSTNSKSYKYTELQKFWMPDSTSIECYDCSVKFSTFRRKHHCRLCGQIFCIKCCNQVVPGKIINCAGDLKVCAYCSKVILAYLKSFNTTSEIKSDFRELQEDLSNKLSLVSKSADRSVINLQHRKVSVGYQEERFISSHSRMMSIRDRRSMLQQSISLRSIYEEMVKVMPEQNHGFELLAFLFISQRSNNKRQAIAILNALIEARFIIPEIETSPFNVFEQFETDNNSLLDEFDENVMYKFIEPINMYDVISNLHSVQKRCSAPSQNSYDNILPPSSLDSGHLTTESRMEVKDPLMSSKGAKVLLQSFCQHEETMLYQLLAKENLDPSWAKILIPIAARVANTIRPQIFGSVESIDIRNYVFLKKIPGGQRHECKSLGGVVFTKNVVHRQMMSCIEKPKILLLQCGIEYQRVEGKFVSFDTLMLQERDYLKNKVTKILSLSPNIVLVHKNVAGIAQDLLRSNGITLVLDVKLCVLQRISRCFECDILTSIDSNVGQPKLGTCDKFQIEIFSDEQGSSKSMMCFVKNYSSRGCCVLLRGGSKRELVKIKKVMSLLLYVRFNWRLELSYLYDACAQLPYQRLGIFGDEELSSCLEDNDSAMIQLNTVSYKHSEKQKIKTMNMERVDTLRDPLRAALSDVSDPINECRLAVENSFDDQFRNALTSTILSISPFMNFPAPYLETDKGRKCDLRRYFPKELYYSKQLCNSKYELNFIEASSSRGQIVVEKSSLHTFTSHRITTTLENKDIQIMIASYRVTGGRYLKRADMKEYTENKEETNTIGTMLLEGCDYVDALDLANHQRLPVLFCSFYDNPNAPSFCAEPSLLEMQFYGHNDIMLGEFLERYCFRSSYICKSCNLPMMDHVRRYVHSHGCIHVELQEDLKKIDTGTILITSKCTTCNDATFPTPMSNDTWCYSLAKYLELRFYSHLYKRQTMEKQKDCNHSLHRDHVQYFSFKGIVASFRYSSIEIWEIGMPTMMLQLKDFRVKNKQSDFEYVKNFALKGYEVYIKIFERLADLCIDTETFTRLKKKANQDQMLFKRRLDYVQSLLVDSESTNDEIEDAVLFLKKTLAEAIDEWEPKLCETILQCKYNPVNTLGDNNTEEIQTTNIIKRDENKTSTAEKNTFMSRLTNNESDHLTESATGPAILEDKNSKESDRRGVKGLLSQLLSSSENIHIFNSPIPNHEHHNLKCGLFPVMVNEKDLASCIAYSLICSEYMKSLEEMSLEYANSPHLKRKSSDTGIPTGQEDVGATKFDNIDKKKQFSSHIDVNFQDSTTSFTCKVFFAREFDFLRNTLLKTPSTNSQPSSKSDAMNNEEGHLNSIRNLFARSLSKSVRWQAQGGKSGSKFSKTLDDRFVLKEMSRTDLSIFEHFATNYFDYLQQCMLKKQPTLLAKIYGVFKVVVRKKDNTTNEISVLVMENLFCDRNIIEKFDLKGSLRNRMVNPNRQSSETVLMDENLMQMSWTNPIYVLTHSSIVLKEVIDRDASFLEKQGVMDYSLLVGFDRSEQKLVVGIIDYIRTFTLDKRVESIIKQSGIMGGHGKLPTVISPKMYKARFIEAMDRYFLAVPDHWEGLSKYCCRNYLYFEQNKDTSK